MAGILASPVMIEAHEAGAHTIVTGRDYVLRLRAALKEDRGRTLKLVLRAALHFCLQEAARVARGHTRRGGDYARSKRSRFITLFQAATKSRTNFSCASALP
jgi:hypothetical protein